MKNNTKGNIIKKLISNQAFTLAEMVVAIGIFSIASLVISTVYLNANNLHQHTANFQRLQNEGRYIMEKVTREVRAREIKYPVEALQPQELLEFRKDEFGDTVKIVRSLNGEDLEYHVNGISANLNADDIEVVNVQFFVVPNTEDQWGVDPTTNIQPRVTFLLKIKNKDINPKFQREITMQTTISSKVYKR